MKELNLVAKNKQEELVKTYLQENASEILVEKINNGTLITKDGITLINKKTLSGFMKYAVRKPENWPKKARLPLVSKITLYTVGQFTILRKAPSKKSSIIKTERNTNLRRKR